MKLLLPKENIIVINTCGFIDKAKGSESRFRIRKERTDKVFLLDVYQDVTDQI
jgi:tRNA A37 methylthiotransferase MiaB